MRKSIFSSIMLLKQFYYEYYYWEKQNSDDIDCTFDTICFNRSFIIDLIKSFPHKNMYKRIDIWIVSTRFQFKAGYSWVYQK